MSSCVQLLLVALAACLRFAAAEGEPLPAALVELVRNSPISSVQDLQLLLLPDSVDEDDGTSAASGGHRRPRSLNAQPAQQALCKVRTEVVEVTRAMLDRSNANFMLWPPCVEVQRCSGCCNTKSLQCAPVATHTRYLQVMKIEYVNKRPAYAKAVVSVVDHVECRCQLAPVPKKKSSRRQHRNQTLSQGHEQGQVKLHSKDELHQWDELKQNQRTDLEELLDQHWSSRGDTFPLPGEDPALLFAPHWAQTSTGLPEPESPEKEAGTDGGFNKTVWSDKDLPDGGTGFLLNSSEDDEENGDVQTHRPEDKAAPVTGSRFRPTKEPNPDPRGQARRRNNETPDEQRRLKMEETKAEEERKELLLLHKRLDEEKETLRQQQTKRDDEEKETDGKRQQLAPTHKPESTASMTTTRKPPAPSGPRPPGRPSQTRRRMRKNRKRISKAAMRAMLM